MYTRMDFLSQIATHSPAEDGVLHRFYLQHQKDCAKNDDEFSCELYYAPFQFIECSPTTKQGRPAIECRWQEIRTLFF